MKVLKESKGKIFKTEEFKEGPERKAVVEFLDDWTVNVTLMARLGSNPWYVAVPKEHYTLEKLRDNYPERLQLFERIIKSVS